MGQNVDEVVSLVFGWRYRVAQFASCMSERRVNNPSLVFSGCPNRIAVPVKCVLGLAMPLEMADVASLPVDRMAVERTHDRDARVRTGRLRGLCCLRNQESGEANADKKYNANDPRVHDAPSSQCEIFAPQSTTS